MKFFLKKLGNKIIYEFPGLYHYLDIKSHFSNLDHPAVQDFEKRFEYETSFKTSDGREIPVYKHYRYGSKPGWKYFGPLAALSELKRLSLLEGKDASFLKKAAGHRTLTVPLEEVRSVLQKYLEKYPDLFLSPIVADLDKRPVKPTSAETNRTIKDYIKSHKLVLKTAGIGSRSYPGQGKLKVLEIGFSSGGESAIAFEKMGFEAHAIDYFFNKSVEQTPRHEYIREQTGSNVGFHLGDITRETAFEAGTFDIIYSQSVVEHILDLDSAFREMHRILKDDGLIIHNYGSFQMPGGGHSLGLLDSPWAHIRLDKEDYYNYIRTLRPYEADIAINWIDNALKPKDTFSTVQKAVTKAGFSIKHWSYSKVKDHYPLLNHEILDDAFRIVPGLTLDDILSKGVLFIASKKQNK